MIPANRQELYNSIVTNIKHPNGYYYQYHPYEWEELFQYLEGKQDDFVLNPTIFDNWGFTNIYHLLGHPYKWTEFDDRIMKILGDYWHKFPTSSPYCLTKERFLNTWIPANFPFDNIGVPQAMNNILLKYGFTEGYLATQLFNYAYRDNEVTVAGLYIFENIEKMFAIMPMTQHNSVFMTLLKTDETVLEKHLNKLIAPISDAIHGMENIPHLLEHNPQKYETFIAEVFKATGNVSQALQVAILLSQYFPKKYNAEICRLCYAYFEFVKLHFKDAYFRFELHYNPKANYRDYFINIVFATLLEKEPYEKAFEAIQNYIKI